MNRRYSDRETAAILTRAAELSAAHDAIAHSDGSSLAELEHIGREAGLDDDSVRAAALELAQPRAHEQGRTGYRRTLDIHGTLDDAGRQAVFHEARAHSPLLRLQPSGGSLLALASPLGTLVSVANAGERTRVVVEFNRRAEQPVPRPVVVAVIGASGLALAAMGAETLAQGAVLAGLGVAMGIVTALGVWLAHPLERYLKRRQQKHFDRLLDDVAAVVREHALRTPQ